MKRLLLTLIASALLLAGPGLGLAKADPPTDDLRNALDSIINILDSDTPSDQKKAEVKEKVNSVFSFIELSKRSLGRPWNDLSVGQREEFVDLFKQLLEQTYLEKINDYNREEVIYIGEKIQDNKAMVMTKIISNNKETLVNYRMIETKGHWMIYDVIAENVSLVKNYREQFHEIVQGQSPDTVGELLLTTLRNKIEDLKNKKPTTASNAS